MHFGPNIAGVAEGHLSVRDLFVAANRATLGFLQAGVEPTADQARMALRTAGQNCLPQFSEAAAVLVRFGATTNRDEDLFNDLLQSARRWAGKVAELSPDFGGTLVASVASAGPSRADVRTAFRQVADAATIGARDVHEGAGLWAAIALVPQPGAQTPQSPSERITAGYRVISVQFREAATLLGSGTTSPEESRRHAAPSQALRDIYAPLIDSYVQAAFAARPALAAAQGSSAFNRDSAMTVAGSDSTVPVAPERPLLVRVPEREAARAAQHASSTLTLDPRVDAALGSVWAHGRGTRNDIVTSFYLASAGASDTADRIERNAGLYDALLVGRSSSSAADTRKGTHHRVAATQVVPPTL